MVDYTISDWVGLIKEFDLSIEESKNLRDGLSVEIGSEIDINDFAVGKIVKQRTKFLAYLVIEEDGSVRWYVNPNDRSDTIIKKVWVEKIRDR